MSIPHKRNKIILDRQKIASTYNNSGIGLLYYNNNHECKIHDLDLPDGLIELLVENNFTPKITSGY